MAELRVLVCDDDHDMLELMLRRLDKMGFKPDRADDGGVAQALIKENLYDLIVTDIYMPEATGLELLEMAKQRDPHVQVVIVTASATLDNAIDALNHGAFGYLSKPFDHLSVFDSTISRALEFRQLIMANRRMAEAQKMRGDMLEDEVAKRVGQLREKQQGLLDLLNCLPDGIVVVEEGGKLMMTSPAAEQWLARERRSEQRPIAEFLGQVHSEWAETNGYTQLGEDKLRLLSIDYPHPNGKKRKAVIIRRSEEEEQQAGPGTLALESVAAIKEGLAWLFRQKLSGPMQQRVRELANHISMLEQVTGASGHADIAVGGSSRPDLAPAVLPEYLRHEPALDAPGGQWVDANAATTGQNGNLASQSERPSRLEPDTRPAASKAKAEQPDPQETWEEKPELAVEEELHAAAEVVEPEVGFLGEAQPAEQEPPAPVEEPLAEESLAEVQPDESEATALEESIESQAVLATAPTKVLDRGEAELEIETQSEPASKTDSSEEPAAEPGPTDTGRVPLWQRISKKRGSTPAKAARPEPEAQLELDAEPELEVEIEPELDVEEHEEELVDVAARLQALAEKEPEAEPAPKPRLRQEAPKPSEAQASPKPSQAQASAKPPEAPASPKPGQSQKAPAREPELAALGADGGAARGKRKAWPPELPSQDPDFDPELDVTG